MLSASLNRIFLFLSLFLASFTQQCFQQTKGARCITVVERPLMVRWVSGSISLLEPTKGRNGNVLFNDALNTFYLRFHDVGHIIKDYLGVRGRKEMFYLTTHSTHFIYGYMALDHADSERGNRHMGYCFRVAARVLLYVSSHRQDNTYHGLCHGALDGKRNRSMGHLPFSDTQ